MPTDEFLYQRSEPQDVLDRIALDRQKEQALRIGDTQTSLLNDYRNYAYAYEDDDMTAAALEVSLYGWHQNPEGETAEIDRLAREKAAKRLVTQRLKDSKEKIPPQELDGRIKILTDKTLEFNKKMAARSRDHILDLVDQDAFESVYNNWEESQKADLDERGFWKMNEHQIRYRLIKEAEEAGDQEKVLELLLEIKDDEYKKEFSKLAEEKMYGSPDVYQSWYETGADYLMRSVGGVISAAAAPTTKLQRMFPHDWSQEKKRPPVEILGPAAFAAVDEDPEKAAERFPKPTPQVMGIDVNKAFQWFSENPIEVDIVDGGVHLSGAIVELMEWSMRGWSDTWLHGYVHGTNRTIDGVSRNINQAVDTVARIRLEQEKQYQLFSSFAEIPTKDIDKLHKERLEEIKEEILGGFNATSFVARHPIMSEVAASLILPLSTEATAMRAIAKATGRVANSTRSSRAAADAVSNGAKHAKERAKDTVKWAAENVTSGIKSQRDKVRVASQYNNSSIIVKGLEHAAVGTEKAYAGVRKLQDGLTVNGWVRKLGPKAAARNVRETLTFETQWALGSLDRMIDDYEKVIVKLNDVYSPKDRKFLFQRLDEPIFYTAVDDDIRQMYNWMAEFVHDKRVTYENTDRLVRRAIAVAKKTKKKNETALKFKKHAEELTPEQIDRIIDTLKNPFDKINDIPTRLRPAFEAGIELREKELFFKYLANTLQDFSAEKLDVVKKGVAAIAKKKEYSLKPDSTIRNVKLAARAHIKEGRRAIKALDSDNKISAVVAALEEPWSAMSVPADLKDAWNVLLPQIKALDKTADSAEELVDLAIRRAAESGGVSASKRSSYTKPWSLGHMDVTKSKQILAELSEEQISRIAGMIDDPYPFIDMPKDLQGAFNHGLMMLESKAWTTARKAFSKNIGKLKKSKLPRHRTALLKVYSGAGGKVKGKLPKAELAPGTLDFFNAVSELRLKGTLTGWVPREVKGMTSVFKGREPYAMRVAAGNFTPVRRTAKHRSALNRSRSLEEAFENGLLADPAVQFKAHIRGIRKSFSTAIELQTTNKVLQEAGLLYRIGSKETLQINNALNKITKEFGKRQVALINLAAAHSKEAAALRPLDDAARSIKSVINPKTMNLSEKQWSALDDIEKNILADSAGKTGKQVERLRRLLKKKESNLAVGKAPTAAEEEALSSAGWKILNKIKKKSETSTAKVTGMLGEMNNIAINMNLYAAARGQAQYRLAIREGIEDLVEKKRLRLERDSGKEWVNLRDDPSMRAGGGHHEVLRVTGELGTTKAYSTLVPKDVAHVYNQLLPWIKKSGMDGAEATFDAENHLQVLYNSFFKPLNTSWKLVATVPRYQYIEQNLFSVPGMAYIGMGAKAFDPKLAVNTMRLSMLAALGTKSADDVLKGMTIQLKNGPANAFEIIDGARNLGMVGQLESYFGMDRGASNFFQLMPKYIMSVLEGYPLEAAAVSAARKAFGKGTQKGEAWADSLQNGIRMMSPAFHARWTENTQHLITYIGFLDDLKMKSIQKAWAKSSKWSANYRLQTPLERNTFGQAFAFWGWYRFIAPHMFRMARHRPKQLQNMIAVQGGLDEYGEKDSFGSRFGYPDYFRATAGAAPPHAEQPANVRFMRYATNSSTYSLTKQFEPIIEGFIPLTKAGTPPGELLSPAIGLFADIFSRALAKNTEKPLYELMFDSAELDDIRQTDFGKAWLSPARSVSRQVTALMELYDGEPGGKPMKLRYEVGGLLGGLDNVYLRAMRALGADVPDPMSIGGSFDLQTGGFPGFRSRVAEPLDAQNRYRRALTTGAKARFRAYERKHEKK